MSTQHLASVQRVHSSHVRCPLLINCVGTMQMFGSDAFADAKLLPLQKQFTELPMQPETARCNLDTVLQMAAEAHNVPLSDIIPLGNVDKSAVASLKQLRSDFIGRIIVFRSGLLPLSRNVVNGLHSFLDYLEDEGDFLELAKAGEVSRLCSKHADEAQYVQEGYEALASDLLMMGKTMNDSFEKVRLDVEKIQLMQHHKDKKVALFKNIAAGLVTAGVTGGAALALALLGPGGVLFAPQLAAGAFSASVAGGVASAAVVNMVAGENASKAVALRESVKVLGNAQVAAKERLPHTVGVFAEAMEHLAQFFCTLHGSIQRIEHGAARIEESLREETLTQSYRALYRVLCRKVAAVKLSCQQYHAFVSHVNIRVNNLALQQDKDVTSYIEDWFKEQEARYKKQDKDKAAKLAKLGQKVQGLPPGTPAQRRCLPKAT